MRRPLSDNEAEFPREWVLLERVFKEPEQGWGEFWGEYRPFVETLILRYRLTKEDSEDLFQEVSLRLAKNEGELLRAWDSQRSSLKGYLSVITTSVCLNFLRSAFHKYSKRKMGYPTQDNLPEVIQHFHDPTPSPRERFERLELLRVIEESLNALEKEGKMGNHDRLLFQYRLAGMTFVEIGQLLGISLENALQRFHRSKQVVRKRLQSLGLSDKGLG